MAAWIEMSKTLSGQVLIQSSPNVYCLLKFLNSHRFFQKLYKLCTSKKYVTDSRPIKPNSLERHQNFFSAFYFFIYMWKHKKNWIMDKVFYGKII